MQQTVRSTGSQRYTVLFIQQQVLTLSPVAGTLRLRELEGKVVGGRARALGRGPLFRVSSPEGRSCLLAFGSSLIPSNCLSDFKVT